ncbi:MAG: efflux RND transporter periplasmic adaptor subunit [bacterium]
MNSTTDNRRRIAKWAVPIGIAAVAACVAVWAVFLRGSDKEATYQTATISRGDIENTVTCTGTLSAVGTVEVGTQVSGTIEHIFVDFNDKVEKNQVLAVVDTTQLAAAVVDAQASLLNTTALYEQALAEYKRNLPLAEKGYVSQEEFLPIETAVKTREAALKSAKASLERAEANFRNAVIRSPIEGTVISRAVESGQTVAASFSTPTLFVIASDLAEMEILVAVDEGDIGQVKQGQPAHFTVQGYPDETFQGTVRQIRLQPETVSNVVTYTAVVTAPNERGLLLPGMTATVDLVVESTTGVLMVPNGALKITPTEKMMAEARSRMPERPTQAGAPSDSTGERTGMTSGRGAGGAPFQGASFGPSSASGGMKVIWLLDQTGHVSMRPVRTGATDGKMTEITSPRGIEEGATVITGLNGQTAGETASGTRDRPPGFRMF